MNPSLLAALCIALLGPAATASADDGAGATPEGNPWEVVRDEAGVTLSRQTLEGSEREFCASTEVAASLPEVLAVLADDARRTEWMSRCVESRRLAETQPGHTVAYTRSDAPWPVADRDSVAESRVVVSPDWKSARIEVRSIESAAMPPIAGAIRMPSLVGYYQLEHIAADRTRIEYQISLDIGGRVPDFVSRFVQEEMPFDTVRDLRAQVEKTRGQYQAEVDAMTALPAVAARPQLPEPSSPRAQDTRSKIFANASPQRSQES